MAQPNLTRISSLPPPLEVVRVLLVEDDQEDYEQMAELLEAAGSIREFRLDWARTFAEGLAALKEQQHDVCLLDYFLGPRDGRDLLKEATRSGITVPVIFLTGKGNIGIERRALASGASDYLIKGELNAEALDRSIRHALDRARSAEAMRDREHQFRSVFEAALDAMLILDDQGRCLDANEASLTLFRLSGADLLGTSIIDLVRAEDKDEMLRSWLGLLADGRREGEFRIRLDDGTERFVEFRATAHVTLGRHLSVLRDITEQRLAERQRLRMAAMLESAADAVIGLALDGTIDYWSPSAERTYGHTAREAVGRSKRLIVPENKWKELDAMLARVRAGAYIRAQETLRRRKDGSTFEASVTLSPVLQNGRIVAVLVITSDISERKRLEAHLAVTDRMASMGVLAAGVGHEINNPLAVAIANLEYIAQLVESSEWARQNIAEPLKDVRDAAERIRNIVRDLKLFSRPDEEPRTALDLRCVTDSAIRMAANEIRHRARLVTDYRDIPPVYGNEARLGQVFLNLIINAAHAIREGEADGNEIRVLTRRGDDQSVIAEVHDTGSGIAAEALERIFEPFFTTKPVGVGTGLGLFICRRIIHEHQGSITVESAVGKGTVFRVRLPMSSLEARPAPIAVAVARPDHRHGRVLVVDDEPGIAKAVERALQPVHEVQGVASGAEALELLKKGDRFDVILCDMMMPQMNGVEFYHHVLQFHPDYPARIVFLTAGAFTNTTREFLATVSNQTVGKPFVADELRTIVDTRMHD